MVHTHLVVGMCVRLSFLYSGSHTQSWTGGVDTYFLMTKDPQPGTGKCGPHTFCSGHVCTAVKRDRHTFYSRPTCMATISLFSELCRYFSHSKLD